MKRKKNEREASCQREVLDQDSRRDEELGLGKQK